MICDTDNFMKISRDLSIFMAVLYTPYAMVELLPTVKSRRTFGC